MPDDFCPPHVYASVCKLCGVGASYADQSRHCDHVWVSECKFCGKKKT